MSHLLNAPKIFYRGVGLGSGALFQSSGVIGRSFFVVANSAALPALLVEGLLLWGGPLSFMCGICCLVGVLAATLMLKP